MTLYSSESELYAFQQHGTMTLWDDVPSEPQVYHRFDLMAGAVAVPLLLWLPEKRGEVLTILFNGAVQRAAGKNPHDVFQRRTWVDDIDGPCLFVSDPTLSTRNSLAIGWGQGESGIFAIPAMHMAVDRVASALGFPSQHRLYFGSSAGGFQALQLAIRDRGSRALVNNPQTDWLKYSVSSSVRALRAFTYKGASSEFVRTKFEGRCSISAAAREYDNWPPVRYLVNGASADDVRVHLNAFMRGYSDASGPTGRATVEVEMYHSPALGHNPLPRARTIDELRTFRSRIGDGR